MQQPVAIHPLLSISKINAEVTAISPEIDEALLRNVDPARSPIPMICAFAPLDSKLIKDSNAKLVTKNR